MTQPDTNSYTLNEIPPFYCRKCGLTGEENFSWDGNCLGCEDGEDDFQSDADKFAEALEEERHIWGPRDEDGELR